MPFISTPYDGSSRRSSGSSVSSLTTRGLDRFNPARKSSVYERASTYQPNGVTVTKFGSLEGRSKTINNGASSSNELSYGISIPSRFSSSSATSSPYTRHEPFGSSTRRDSSTSSYLRSDSNGASTHSNNNNDYSSYGGGSSNSSTLERAYKRSDSANLYGTDNGSSVDSSTPAAPATTSVDNNMNRFASAFSSRKNSMDFTNGMADLTKRINETLARHGLDDKRTIPSYEPPAPAKPSFSRGENRYSSRESRDREIVTPATGSWRKRHDSNGSELRFSTSSSATDVVRPDSSTSRHQTPQPSSGVNRWEIPDASSITSLKTVISRSTSPTSDPKRQVRTRIARTTDPIVVEQRRSRKPRVLDAFCQTDTIPEFGTLRDHLHAVTQRVEENPPSSIPQKQEVVSSPSFDYFARLKQTLMETPSESLYVNNSHKFDTESEDDYYEVKRAPMMMLLPGAQPSKKVSDASTNKDETEEESEYTYESEEEEEEDGGVRGESLPPDLESYEAKAERVLEEQRERVSIAPELDYIDEEDEDAPPQVTSPKRKKKGTFISGTVDIDDLLAKEQTPTNFALDDTTSSTTDPPAPEVVNFPLSEAKKHVDFSPQVETQNLLPNEEDEEEVERGDVEEEYEEEEQDGAGEEEGDWEWEYYEDEASKEDQPEEEEEEVHVREKPKIEADPPWILKGLKHCVPRIPTRADTDKLIMECNDYEDDDEPIEEQADGMNVAVSSGDLTSAEKEMGYKEWLEESAELHKGAHLHLQAEIEAEEDILLKSPASSSTTLPSAKEASIELLSPISSSSGKVSKASRLVEKIRSSEEMDLKRVLFSLKTFFQSDKDLVYEFVKEGGLSQLIELGEDEEAQLQNLILRALGQIMLYVDGMNGVIENTRAVQFLYKLVLASNPLVCKTAIKLLLVFVEYTESNCLLLIKAINAVDKELGVIPWSNIITTVQNANKDSSRRTAIDSELAMYALTLVNKCLYGIPDQDTFYDQTDYMEELNMSSIIDSLTALDSAEGVDGGLMQQVQLYNVALKQEDGEPVTEEEISYLDEDATESGLRTTLRAKADSSRGKRKLFQERKSLRYKTKMLADGEVDSQGDMAGISIRDVEIILAKHGLPTSRSGTRLNALTLNGFLDKARGVFNAKLSKGNIEDEEDDNEEEDNDNDILFEREGQAKWDEIIGNINRPLRISDLDFTDLTDESDENNEDTDKKQVVDSNGIPLPPPIPPPPPMMMNDSIPPPPPPAPSSLTSGAEASLEKKWQVVGRKSKKTAKLFWKEIRLSQAYGHQSSGETIWDDMEPAGVDTAMIEYLFENRAKEAAPGKDSKQVQLSSAREIIVLDHKRSNAINIGMTKLPPPRVIKSAVMKMDSTIMNREGVEKLLTMLPSEEETTRINEAQEAQPDIPLGTAEQFLQTLSSISCLEARLRLWSFKMEFEVIEKEVCEPLMDLKVGLASIRKNTTFKTILNVLLTFGNFLNGSACRGFQLDYLEKVPEVKDTVHKHSLLYHMTYWVLETYPASSDLYSEIGPLTRVSRTDFNELEKTLKRMENECKNAWDYLKIITRHDEKQLKLMIMQAAQEQSNSELLEDAGKILDDPNEPMRRRVQEFLTDAAERIFIMMKVQKRVHKRYIEFLTWMGIPVHFHADYPVHKSCKILSEFALEYRTTRERVIQTIEKKKAARERKRREKKAAQIAAALAEAAKLQRDHQIQDVIDHGESNVISRDLAKRISREEMEDTQLRLLLGQDIDITENGTLRRKKKHGSRHHKHHKKSSSSAAAENGDGVTEESMDDLQRKFDEREHNREKKTRRHRSSMLEGTLPLTEDNLKNFASNEMERGLLETLMATSDSSTLKRNKERRKSVKERRSHDLKRSRTRENNVLEDLESAAEALAHV